MSTVDYSAEFSSVARAGETTCCPVFEVKKSFAAVESRPRCPTVTPSGNSGCARRNARTSRGDAPLLITLTPFCLLHPLVIYCTAIGIFTKEVLPRIQIE